MTDLWSFLLQTLTASSAAFLLLVVKAMFRDKLSPRWQFAAWGVLALVLLFPAGLGGRYALVNWPFLLEVFKSWSTGDYGSVTQVLAPIPLPSLALPNSVPDWLFLLYVAGVLLLLLRYLLLYARLRRALQRETPAEDPIVQAVAERYYLPTCPVVRVPGLSSAFVCGVFHPVLALPAGAEPDEKVVLHELLHFVHRDVAWGLVICFFRCVHWCNPLLWFCANLAQNDLEARCDQRVLEQLEGEERRQYGHILLSMADEKYARAPGTSSMANGLRNIRRRIQAIARFKKYPAGMSLVSACMVLVLATPLLVGSKQEVPSYAQQNNINSIMARGRLLHCTTYAGALDTYAKALLVGVSTDSAESLSYLAACTPISRQNDLVDLYWSSTDKAPSFPSFPGLPNVPAGYQIYNLSPVDKDSFEGLLAFQLLEPPNGEAWSESGDWIAAQIVRTEKQGDRWVVLPQGDFFTLVGVWDTLGFDNPGHEMPVVTYEGNVSDFSIQVFRQNMCYVDSTVNSDPNDFFGFSVPYFSTIPQPDGVFSIQNSAGMVVNYTGLPENKALYHKFNFYATPLYEGVSGIILPDPNELSMEGTSSTSDIVYGGQTLEDGWDNPLRIPFSSWYGGQAFRDPASYSMRLSFNGNPPENLLLLPVEGGNSHD